MFLDAVGFRELVTVRQACSSLLMGRELLSLPVSVALIRCRRALPWWVIGSSGWLEAEADRVGVIYSRRGGVMRGWHGEWCSVGYSLAKSI